MGSVYSKYLTESSEDFEFKMEDLSLYTNVIDRYGMFDSDEAKEDFHSEMDVKLIKEVEKHIKNSIKGTYHDVLEVDLIKISASINITVDEKVFFKVKNLTYKVILEDKEVKETTTFISDNFDVDFDSF